jgi:hypothetical protein
MSQTFHFQTQLLLALRCRLPGTKLLLKVSLKGLLLQTTRAEPCR